MYRVHCYGDVCSLYLDGAHLYDGSRKACLEYFALLTA